MPKSTVTLEGIHKLRPASYEQEIERRFFVERMPFGGKAYPNTRREYPHSEMIQFYVEGRGIEDGGFRLRRQQREGEIRFYAAIKRGGGLYREEMRWRLSESEFRSLLRGKEWPFLRKTRYYLPHDGEGVELDVFHTFTIGNRTSDLKGLVTAEVEFKSIRRADRFEAPDWFGKEITWERGFGNGAFARNGMPDGIKLLLR